MELEDLQRLMEQGRSEVDHFRTRAGQALGRSQGEVFHGRSRDGLASASVRADGQVLELNLPRGFGDLNRPAWALADDVDSACRAIVEAINVARRAANDVGIANLRDAFPGAFDLLTDLAPGYNPGPR